MAIINGTAGTDFLNGTTAADTISAKGGNDLVQGSDGNDKLLGDAGDDRLRGQSGNDTLLGGSGNDQLDGGVGNDVLTGGGGSDRFTYFSTEGNDIIMDFSRETDSFIDIGDANSQGLRSFYGDTIEVGDPGVSSVNGDLVIDFGVAPSSVAPGGGDLILKGLGGRGDGLTVGDDIF